MGAVALALTVGVFARRGRAVQGPPEDMHDAVMAAPVTPAMAGGIRVVQNNQGYFASPGLRRADAEKQLLSSRLEHVARAANGRAAALRRASRNAQ